MAAPRGFCEKKRKLKEMRESLLTYGYIYVRIIEPHSRGFKSAKHYLDSETFIKR